VHHRYVMRAVLLTAGTTQHRVVFTANLQCNFHDIVAPMVKLCWHSFHDGWQCCYKLPQ